MTVISKQWFDERIGPDVICKNLFHPWAENCLTANAFAAKLIVPGVANFFVPVYVIQAIMDYKKINKQYSIKLLINFSRSVCYGVCFGMPVITLNCVLSHCFGIHYYNIGLLVGVVSGLSLLIESPKNKRINSLLVFVLVMESFMLKLDYFNIFKLTKRNQTLLFMACSSCLMYLMKTRPEKYKFLHFWFYVPHRQKEIEDKANLPPTKHCTHPKSCNIFLLEGFSKYFVLGYALNIVKAFLSRFSKLRSPSEVLKILINVNNVRYGLFQGLYAVIFRYISCYSLKKLKKENSFTAAVAGLLAGSTYRIKPDIKMLVIAIVTMLQILGYRVKESLRLPDEIPFRQVFFMLGNGVLFHTYLVAQETCPKFYRNMATLGSRGLIDITYKSVLKHLMSGGS